MRSRRYRTVAILITVSVLGIWLRSSPGGLPPARAAERAASRPNIVVIVTDDQRIGMLWAMDGVRQLATRGMTFRNAIVSDPLCCPARASLLTGRYAGGHGVWSNAAPYGWQAFHDAGNEEHTVATALQAGGYRTGLIGRYLNGYGSRNNFVPPGWDRWFALAEGTGAYYGYDAVDFDAADGVVDRRHFGAEPRDYSTSVIGQKAVSFIRATPVGRPLFLYAAVRAPHGPSTPAHGDRGTFDGRDWAHGPAFNERDVRDKPRYIRVIDPLSFRQIRDLELRTQRASETLLSVDRMVVRLIDALRDTHRLANTMVVFTSDNGIARGEHRWQYKVVPYEESVRVPLIVRYDPLMRGTSRAGSVSEELVANVDMAPTLAKLGGVVLDAPVDGVTFDELLAGGAPSRSEVLLESLKFQPDRGPSVPSYCGLRTLNRKYVRYGTGEEEFYRLDKDPAELVNLAASNLPTMTSMRLRTQALCAPAPPGFVWPA